MAILGNSWVDALVGCHWKLDFLDIYIKAPTEWLKRVHIIQREVIHPINISDTRPHFVWRRGITQLGTARILNSKSYCWSKLWDPSAKVYSWQYRVWLKRNREENGSSCEKGICHVSLYTSWSSRKVTEKNLGPLKVCSAHLLNRDLMSQQLQEAVIKMHLCSTCSSRQGKWSLPPDSFGSQGTHQAQARNYSLKERKVSPKYFPCVSGLSSCPHRK